MSQEERQGLPPAGKGVLWVLPSRYAPEGKELDRLREIHSKLKMQTSRMQLDEKEKRARTELAQEVVEASGLTAGLADTLIDRVYVYPNNQLEIVWKIEDFCIKG